MGGNLVVCRCRWTSEGFGIGLFPGESVFVSVCIVPEMMFGVEVASGDAHVVLGFVCDLV